MKSQTKEQINQSQIRKILDLKQMNSQMKEEKYWDRKTKIIQINITNHIKYNVKELKTKVYLRVMFLSHSKEKKKEMKKILLRKQIIRKLLQ